MKKIFVIALFLCVSFYLIGEDLNKESIVNDYNFTIKGHIGYCAFPGLIGYFMYLQVENPFGFATGLSYDLDFHYSLLPDLLLGLNIAYLPITHFDQWDVKVEEQSIPIMASLLYEYLKVLHLNLGLGITMGHAKANSENPYAYFEDPDTGEIDKDTDIWKGPYFTLFTGFGLFFDLSGEDRFGLDLFLKAYYVSGPKNLDTLGELAEEYVSVPGFVMHIFTNMGGGIYYRF